jgi:hypothetical protein
MTNLIFSAQISEQALNKGVFFDGTQPRNEPVQIRVLRQTSSGTADALSLVKLDSGLSETIQTTARYNFTVEPTSGDVLESYNIHPQQGIFVPYVLGQEIILPGGTRLGIDCNAPNDVNARAFIIGEE